MRQNGAVTCPPRDWPASRPRAYRQESVTELLGGIARDGKILVEQHLQMLSAELSDNLNRTKHSAEMGGLGIVLMTVGGQALVFACVYLLAWLDPAIPLWVAFGAIGLTTLIVGIFVSSIGKRLLQGVSPVPTRTLAAFQESLQWILGRRN